MKKSSKITMLFLSLFLFFIVIGVSYAFFKYKKSALYSYTINGGKISVIYTEAGNNVMTLNNTYPLSDSEALNSALEFNFTVTGYNESEKDVYYAIEIEHGNDVNSKLRFRDDDIKLSLYENNNLIIKNEIFDNLENRSIYYGYIEKGTSESTPTVNNYSIRLWINDKVLVTNTPEYLDVEGKNVYSTSDFSNSYANFKVNIKANITGEGIGSIFYDANEGAYTPKQTNLLTNKITLQKPVKEGKAFLGWSEDKNATVPTYKAGDYYGGDAKLLYAVYGDTRNVMNTFPSTILEHNNDILEIHFINDSRINIDTRYNNATIKADLTYNSEGSVLGWLEANESDNTKYNLYVGSDGITYLKTGEYLFYQFKNVKIIDLTNVDSSMVTTMESMFGSYYYDEENDESIYESCSVITNIDVSGLNTSSVTSMNCMFGGCYKLTNLNVENFDMSSVLDAESMFDSCNTLVTLDVSNFNTSKVTTMAYMFYDCNTLKSIDVTSFNTSEVTTMKYMFYECRSLKNIDVTNFNTSKVTIMKSMFNGCSELINLSLENFDASKVTNMAYMFYGCRSLKNIDVTNFNTLEATTMEGMFYKCSSLKSLDVSNFDTSKVITMESMFDGCSKLINLSLENFDTSKVTDMAYMFCGCSCLKNLNIGNFVTAKVTKINNMFDGCKSLSTLDISGFTFNEALTTGEIKYYANFLLNMSSSVIVTVNSATEQAWILELTDPQRPTEWTAANVVIKSA